MKKIVSIILTMCMIVTMLPFYTIAQETVEQTTDTEWEYSFYGNGVELTAYKGNATDVYVPSSITVDDTEYAVLKLADSIFEDNDSLNSVTLGVGILEIGDRAFYDCDNLVCILLAEETTTIGNEAFYSCDNFNSVILYDTVTTIGINTFSECPKLVIWCNVNTVGYNYAIENNIFYKLLNPDAEPETYIQSGVTYYIMNGEAIAINFDNSVTEVVIPSVINGYPVTNLIETFKNSKVITSVVLPVGISFIGENLFYGCNLLSYVKLPEGIVEIKNNAFRSCNALSEIIIPSGVSVIGDNAFYDSGLKKLILPEGVKHIGESAFWSCSKLESVSFPSTISSVGKNAFKGCNLLKNVDVADICAWAELDFYSVESNPLCYSKKLSVNGVVVTDLVIPEGISKIGSNSFVYAKNLVSVSIPEGVESVGNGAFSYCTSLLSLFIPSTLKVFEEDAFFFTYIENAYITDVAAWCNIDFIAHPYNENLYVNGELANNLVIPKEVKRITNNCFVRCTSIENVVISEGVEEIGESSFDECTNLRSVTISGSVKTISDTAFYMCDKLTDVTLAEGVERIGSLAFSRCPKLEKITLPQGLKEIGSSAFASTALFEITIPSSVTTIEGGAFSGREFEMVEIPEGVISFSATAFNKTTVLLVYEGSHAHCVAQDNELLYYIYDGVNKPAITVIDGVTYMAGTEFAVALKCDSTVKEINIPSTVCGKPVTKISTAFKDSSVTSVIIPNTVTTIEAEAFKRSSIENIIIPNSVTQIGKLAFADCVSLKSAVLSDNMTSIPSGMFSYCAKLNNITIPNGVEIIGQQAFENCTALTSIQIPDTVKTIGARAFSYCVNLKKIFYGNGLETVGTDAFFRCSGLQEVHTNDIAKWCTMQTGGTLYEAEKLYYNNELIIDLVIPDGVTTVNGNAFYYAKDILSVVVPRSVVTLSTTAFPTTAILLVYKDSYAHTFAVKNDLSYYVIEDGEQFPVTTTVDGISYLVAEEEAHLIKSVSKQVEIIIPDNVHGKKITEIKRRAFFQCDTLTSIVLPDTINNIATSAFYECANLSNISLPDELLYIGSSAFCRCTSLTEIVIPEKVTELGNNVFSGCSNLTSVIMSDSVTFLGTDLFSGCTNLNNVKLSSRLTVIPKDTFEDCSSLEELTIPYGVKVLEAYSLYNSGIVEVEIPSSVITIKFCAFAGCKNLLEVVIPESVNEIGSTLFSGCTNLKRVEFPQNTDTIKSLQSTMFKECTKLEEVVLPKSLTSIGEKAFYMCTSLVRIKIPESVTSIANYAFQNCSKLEEINIPNGVTNIGVMTFAGTGFKEFNIPKSITNIDNYAFQYCSKLQTINIPSNVRSMGRYAFAYCTSLKSLTVHNSSNSIGEAIFMGCKSLKYVDLGTKMRSIGKNAFSDCTSLRTIIIPKSVYSINTTSFPSNTILMVYENSSAHTIAQNNNKLYFVIPKTENPEIAYGAGVSGTVRYSDGTVASGATVEILYDDGVSKETVITNSKGAYEFTYAEVGRYTIRVTDADSNTASTTVGVKRMNVFDVFVAGDTDLVLKNSYSISGIVNEVGATVTLTDTEGNVIESITSDENGNFVFENIPNGEYIVKAETVNGSVIKEITVFNSNVTGIELVIETETSSVWGYVEVEDRDGKQNRRNWVQVTIYNDDGVAVDQCKTDKDGKYSFSNLPLGDYVIVAETSEMRPDKKHGYDRSHTLTGYAYVEVTELKDYEVDTIVLYEENDEKADIVGKVTAKGNINVSEVILANIFGDEIDAVTTGKNGKFVFKNVADGMYFIYALTENDGFGFAVVVVRNGNIYGDTHIKVEKHSYIQTLEDSFKYDVPECNSKDDALIHKERIAQEKHYYDSLSKKEKKQLSKEYVERLNKYTEWLADCEYTANNGVTVEQGGLVVSQNEINEEANVTFTINVEKTDTPTTSEDGINNIDDHKNHSIKDKAGKKEIMQYYEITMTKSTADGDKAITSVYKDTDSNGKFRITLTIPEEYRGYKHYSFVHEHYGEVVTLTDLDNDPDTVTFEVDKFSTFALTATNEEQGSELLSGDINMDGNVNATDITQLRKVLFGKAQVSDILADVSNDDSVNILDLVVAKKITLQ